MNVKEFDIGLHKSVDDKQFGGGGGMVIRPDGLGNTIDSVLSKCTYYFLPRGRNIDNILVKKVILQRKGLFAVSLRVVTTELYSYKSYT